MYMGTTGDTEKNTDYTEGKNHLKMKYNNEQFAISRDVLNYSIKDLMELL